MRSLSRGLGHESVEHTCFQKLGHILRGATLQLVPFKNIELPWPTLRNLSRLLIWVVSRGVGPFLNSSARQRGQRDLCGQKIRWEKWRGLQLREGSSSSA